MRNWEPWRSGRRVTHDRRPHLQRMTRRLVLQAATIEMAEAELRSSNTFGVLLGAAIPSGWPPGEYDRSAQEFFLEQLRQRTDNVLGWYSWYAVHVNGSSRTLVGVGGFLGPPDESGFVEIGFSIHPDWYGRGFASEMAGELVAFAFEHNQVRAVVGNSTRDNVASCRVFSHLGFTEIRSGPDSEKVHYVLKRQSAPA